MVPRDANHLLVTSAEMAALEAELFESGLPVAALMEKAALGVSRHLLEHEQLKDGVLVLVGPGHNGGDGLVVARELHLAGVAVRIWCPFGRRKPLTEAHLRHAIWLGIPLLQEAPDPAMAELWVDALFGIGQRQAPAAELTEALVGRQRQQPGHLLAIDVPTGLCADTGRRLGAGCAIAHCTTTIGLIKTGLVQDQALAAVGQLVRIDLGLPPGRLGAFPESQPLGLASRDLGLDLSRCQTPAPDPARGKYARGRALVIAGSLPYRGAAALALAGATSSGCGSLRAALPAPMGEQLWREFPHVVLAQELVCHSGGALALESFQISHLERLDAVLVGPGIGSPDGGQGFWQALQQIPCLVVIDADGLNRLAQSPDHGQAWLKGREGPTWLTPHRGEFSRLFPAWADLPALEAASRAAIATGASILLKGARSVVASPDGRRWQLLEANPRVARAGLGDVLAGYATGRGAICGGDGSILAMAALEHAQAGCLLDSHPPERPSPGRTPQAVASVLADINRENVSFCD